MKIAVVFDSAGTLLRMYRVAKNINTGAILNEVVSTELVGKKPHCALLVMQIDSNRLVKCPPDMLISDFIRKYKIGIDVGCSRAQVDNETALSVVKSDMIATMSDLQDVMAAVNKNARIFSIWVLGSSLMWKKKAFPMSSAQAAKYIPIAVL